MGSVWRATQLALQRPVAIKFLYARGPRPDMQAERFLREARIAASVVHRNVVDTLDFGVAESGEHYMVMSLLQGVTLAKRLEKGPPLPVEELVRIIAMALRGLGAVHDAGIIHRDLKPENIFLVNDPEGAYPKLLDFGISRILAPEDDGRRSALTTKEGVMVGTPQYMSPEQARGLKNLDKRTDIYSMGVILYEALTGRLPYDADAIGDLLLLILAGKAPTVAAVRPEVGPEISHVVERAMARDREARYFSATEMQKALMDAQDSTAGSRFYPRLSTMPRPIRSNFPPPVAIVDFNNIPQADSNEMRTETEENLLQSLLEGQPQSEQSLLEEKLTVEMPGRSDDSGREPRADESGADGGSGSIEIDVEQLGIERPFWEKAVPVKVLDRLVELFRGPYRWLAAAGVAVIVILLSVLAVIISNGAGAESKPAARTRPVPANLGGEPAQTSPPPEPGGKTATTKPAKPAVEIPSAPAAEPAATTAPRPSNTAPDLNAAEREKARTSGVEAEPKARSYSRHKRSLPGRRTQNSTKSTPLILRKPDF